MKANLVTGLTHTQTHEVTPERTTGHAARAVLATPSMIGLIEGTCLAAMTPHLDAGETSVGAHVCVSHEAAVPAGHQITVSVAVAEIVKRRVTFETTVQTGEGQTVSRGTHQRAVIDARRFTAA